MRTAVVFNFLIESGIIASLGIVLMLFARRFEASYRLNAEGEPSRWYFHLKSLIFGGLYSDGYEVALDAQTGEILFCFGMDEGNG